MKKLLLVLSVLIAITIETHAQIPNSGFETWENYSDGGNTYQKPDMWNGSLPYSPMTHSYSLSQNPESYPAGTGQYSLKIQADVDNGVRGVAISNDGSDPMINWIPQPSFAINYQPTSLFLYYKYFPSGGDTMLVNVYFYKEGEVIARCYFGTTETISEWTELEVPMTFETEDVPDSATIFCLTGIYTQHSESVLYVDNLSFSGFVVGINEPVVDDTDFMIYPNPASDIVSIETELKDYKDVTLQIYTINGKLVKSERLDESHKSINIKDLSNGVYIVEVNSFDLFSQRKLIISR